MGYLSAAAEDKAKIKPCRVVVHLSEIESEDAAALTADLDNPAVGDQAIWRRLAASRTDTATVVGVNSVKNHRQGTCPCQ